ncbi:hypothetical protein R6L23_05525 [Streptomyces sp. SR27]|uniref:hypothetical protein n=1 Tax=Streptomyces sp. SR27 TaxID=3076630 RepID=UPI00295BE75E|nr:hypothetical protein [Streptomyces sp. SR27]MDV9187680.1 hypothetical protein [Streptomyces sp. SR27]
MLSAPVVRSTLPAVGAAIGDITELFHRKLFTADWEPGNTPAMDSLTHQGIRRVEAEEEEHG